MAVWIYYLSAFLLLVANCGAWLSNFVRLPGNWIIVANSLLLMMLLPQRDDGVGVGLFAVLLLAALAVFGDSFNLLSRRHRLFSRSPSDRTSKPILIGAGLGSLTCVVAGLAVPVIGPFIAVIGAVGGAAGGGWVGSLLSPPVPEQSRESSSGNRLVSRVLTPEQIRLIPRISTGIVMLAVATYASFY